MANQEIDAYIATFPVAVQAKLNRIRELIRSAAPGASEKIAYQIPTFYLNGNLVHYAAFKKHIGFYPTSSGIAAFEQDLLPYKHAKGSVQFPLDQDLPEDLILRMVKFRVAEQQ